MQIHVQMRRTERNVDYVGVKKIGLTSFLHTVIKNFTQVTKLYAK